MSKTRIAVHRPNMPKLALTILALSVGGLSSANAASAAHKSDVIIIEPMKGVIGDYGLE